MPCFCSVLRSLLDPEVVGHHCIGKMTEYTLEWITHIIILILNIFTILLNIFGIYTLHASNIGGSNQIKIIMGLSLSDISMSVTSLCISALSLIGHSLPDSQISLYVFLPRAGTVHAWYSMNFLLTLDRLFGCNFPFKYRIHATKRRLKIIMAICWITSLAVVPVFYLPMFDLKKIYLVCNRYLWISYDAIFMALFMVTYTSILYRKIRRNERFRRATIPSENQRFFLVTTSLMVAFIFLEVFPSIASSVLVSINGKLSLSQIAITEFAYQLNTLSDPIIYIFLLPVVRQTAATKIRTVLGLGSKVAANRTRDDNDGSQGEQANNKTIE